MMIIKVISKYEFHEHEKRNKTVCEKKENAEQNICPRKEPLPYYSVLLRWVLLVEILLDFIHTKPEFLHKIGWFRTKIFLYL